MIAATVPYRRVPWLTVEVEPGQGDRLVAVIGCNQCKNSVSVTIDPEDPDVRRHGALLTHFEGCPVPVALARAAASRLN